MRASRMPSYQPFVIWRWEKNGQKLSSKQISQLFDLDQRAIHSFLNINNGSVNMKKNNSQLRNEIQNYQQFLKKIHSILSKLYQWNISNTLSFWQIQQPQIIDTFINSRISMPKLQILDLRSNGIQSIQNLYYLQASSLRVLWLNGNNITNVNSLRKWIGIQNNINQIKLDMVDENRIINIQKITQINWNKANTQQKSHQNLNNSNNGIGLWINSFNDQDYIGDWRWIVKLQVYNKSNTQFNKQQYNQVSNSNNINNRNMFTPNGIYLKSKNKIIPKIMKFIAKTKFVKKDVNVNYGYGSYCTTLIL